MDWGKLLSELKAAGWDQSAVAAAVGVKPPSISRIATGVTADPAHSLGEAIRELHRRVVPPAANDGAQERLRA